MNRSVISIIESCEPRRLLATFVVTSSADSGAGTLREAIALANATTALDVINFNIAGAGVKTIGLMTSLSATQPVALDATTQPGYSTSPLIRLNDSNNQPYGLSLSGAGSVVRGLSITGFGNPGNANDGTGIIVNAKSTIEKCYIGLQPNGTTTANEGAGIQVIADETIIRNNIISGNGKDGVKIDASNVVLTGNIIGLNPTGSSARPNLENGIRINSGIYSRIGSSSGLAADRNVISANGQSGVLFSSSSVPGDVLNNYIGLSATGNAMFNNGDYGVKMIGTSNSIIGNSDCGNRFGGDGILITGNGGGNFIRYNTFGIGINPFFDVGDSVGINLDSSNWNEVEYNTVGRVGTGIRANGSNNNVKFNHVGITDADYAIPNDLGITVNGNNNEIEGNYVSNNSLYGVWCIAGDGNLLRNSAWNNGQSVWVSSGANSNLPKMLVHSITENVDGSYTANVGGTFTQESTYRFAFYSSDGPGHATSGDTQRLLKYIDSHMFVGGQGFNANFNSGLWDGQYLTVQVMKIRNDGSSWTTGEPSMAKKAVGSPAVYSSSFEFETQNAWNFEFSADVSASLNVSDLSIRNTDTNQTYQASSVTWNSSTKTARWTRNTALPDGRYVASIASNSVSSSSGSNIGNFPMSFFFLRGDATRDGIVNFNDLLIVSQNYGQTNQTFSQGDFNYDGNVNFTDLVMLAQRYGTSLFVSNPIGFRTRARTMESLRDVI